jgi:hypothetical protein
MVYPAWMARTNLICLSITMTLTLAASSGCPSDDLADTSGGTGDTADDTGDTNMGTETGDGDGDPGPLTFEADIYPIITANCSCHVLGADGMLEMPDAPTAYSNLFMVPSTQEPNLNRVTPGDAANSYIHQKITGTQAGLSDTNVQMPNTGTQLSTSPLSAEQMAMFEDWINDGAVQL